MKRSIIFLSLFSFLLITNKSFAQGEAAVWFLDFPISPSQNAMGYTGTSLPIDDPYGFLLNPAQLGYTSQHNNFSYMLYPSEVKLWGLEQIKIKGSAFNVGYNFKNLIGIPMSAGIGYANPEIDFNFNNPNNNQNIEERDKYETYSLGVGFDYLIQFYAGITYKNIDSKVSDYSSSLSPLPFYEANAKTIDYGFLINVPVLKLINNEIFFMAMNKYTIKPFFNISLGYSQSNIGDEIYYIDPDQKDPLPRIARLGYGISTGIDTKCNENLFRVFGFDFTVDAEDLLLNFKKIYGPDYYIKVLDGYQSFIGDINIGRNILQVKGDENVIVHAGVQFNFLESLILKYGQMKGRSDNNRSTNGFEIRSAGLLRFIGELSGNSAFKFISSHFDIRYYNSNYSVEESLETNIKGIAFFVKNLNLLF